MYRRKNQLILVDEFRRKKSASLQERALFLKAIAYNEFLPDEYRYQAMNYLSNPHFNKTKIKNRCKEISRSRSVISAFKYYRHTFRKYAETGFLPGVRRSSW